MAFINGSASISSQLWTDYNNFSTEIKEVTTNLLAVHKPNYKEFIKPMQARRMSKTVKNSIFASAIALQQANIQIPDAIITGTGLGIVSDTEKFLNKLIDNKEQFLTPTSFIQSTHNTVAAQIAARIKCHGYNFTYVNRGHSFDNALQDALMQLNEGEKNILVGGSDEMTQEYFNITSKADWWKREEIKNTDIFSSKTQGALCGEGSSFFVISADKNESTQAQIKAIKTFSKPKNSEEINSNISSFLSEQGINPKEIDILMLGKSGDNRFDTIYDHISNSDFKKVPTAGFKHLTGEYHTASSYALWLCATILKTKKYPDFIKLNPQKPKQLKNILIYNHYFNINHTIILVSDKD